MRFSTLYSKTVTFLSLLALSVVLVQPAEAVPSFQSTLSQPSRLIKNKQGRLSGIRSYNDSDFILGALVPVHRAAVNSSGALCGDQLTDFGLQQVEEILYVLDRINSDADFLPNLTLGYDIRDTCISTSVALSESLELLVSAADLELASCSVSDENSQPFLLGVLGATVSAVSIPVASLLGQFMVPQVSYASTSTRLNDRSLFGYFLRTVPPDDLQAMAMYQLALKFNWTLVSAIHSNDAYGDFGIEEFRRRTRENSSICVDFDEGIDVSFTDTQHHQLAERLVNESRASVVILFSTTSIARQFLQAVRNFQAQRKFVWIVSDAISVSPSIRKEFGDLLVGMFGFHPFSETFLPFESFFANVTLGENKRNQIWYNESCSNLFNETCHPNASVVRSPRYVNDIFSTPLINAIYSFAYGLDRYLKENCELPVVWNRTTQSCQGLNRTLTRALLLEYIQSSNFTSPTGFRVMFDPNGNSQGIYSVSNLITNSSGGLILQTVGTYNPASNTFQLETNKLQFGITRQGEPILTFPNSQCTMCESGSIFVPNNDSCCGTCQRCLGNSSTNGSSPALRCFPCSQLHWGRTPLNGSSGCIRLDEIFISHNEAWGILIIVISVLGLLLVTTVIVLVGIFWNTPVIKSFGREQMVLLLIGLIISFIIPCFFVIKPSFGICLVRHLGVSFCFSLVFGALLVKLIRITRIFLAGNMRQRFIKPYHQIIFTFLIVAWIMMLSAISLIVAPPNTIQDVRSNSDDSNDFPTLILTCQPRHLGLSIILLISFLILIILSSVLAIFTIRFPANFNEARHVSFCIFAIVVVWLAFIPSFFFAPRDLSVGLYAFALLLTAFSVLLCLFGPRIFVAIVHHYKNQRNNDGTTVNSSSHGSEAISKSFATVTTVEFESLPEEKDRNKIEKKEEKEDSNKVGTPPPQVESLPEGKTITINK